MALLRMKDLGALEPKALGKKLKELRRELSTEKGSVQGVGRTVNPGRIRTIRRTIARLLTYAKQKGIDVEKKAMVAAPKTAAKPEAKKTETKPAAKPEAKKAEAKEWMKAEARKAEAKPAAKVEAKKEPDVSEGVKELMQ